MKMAKAEISKRRIKRPTPKIPINTGILEIVPDRKVTRIFRIVIGREPVGFIGRGHRGIEKMRPNDGIFPQALKELEEFEQKQFFYGKFEQYKNEIAQGLSVNPDVDKRVSEEIAYVRSARKPQFFDYTTYPLVASKFLTHGYALHEITIKKLRRAGMKNTTLAGITNFLHEREDLRGTMVFLLVKKIPRTA